MMKVEEFQTVIKKVRSKLLRIAFQATSSNEEAEDLVQESCIRIWIAQEQWNRYNNMEAILVKTLNNCIIDHYRRKKYETEPLEETQQFKSNILTPHQEMEAKDNFNRMLILINRLPNLQKLIIKMKDIDGYEIEEIANITQTSCDSVRMNLSRARKSLREQIILQNQ